MPRHDLSMLILKMFWLLFVLANGACVGSLINVLVYRLPRGISVIWPPSRCPSCETKLTWRENIPVFGWIFCRGRCRFCGSPVSPEYPLVEAFTALLFGAVFACLMLLPAKASWLGVNWGGMRPEWAWNPAEIIWPTIVVVLLLVGALVAMTLVDLKTFTIPAPLTTVPAVAALLIHPAHAAWYEYRNNASRLPRTAPGYEWAMPIAPSWSWMLGAFGAAAGLVLAILLVRSGLLRRSFYDYDEWERQTLEEQAKAAGTPITATDQMSGEIAPTSIEPVAEPLALVPQPAAVPEPAKETPPVSTETSPGHSHGHTTAIAIHEPPEDQLAPFGSRQWRLILVSVVVTAGLAALGAWLANKSFRFPSAIGVVLGLCAAPILLGFIFGDRSPPPEEADQTQRQAGSGGDAKEPSIPVTAAETPTADSSQTAISPLPPVSLSHTDPSGSPEPPQSPLEVIPSGIQTPDVSTAQASSAVPLTEPAAEARPDHTDLAPTEMWLAYPHARREMVRELAFLAPCLVLGFLAWHIPHWLVTFSGPPPLWLKVLAGVIMGYVIGGGVVWLVRILGSLAAGREAMGLGDVHMMAAVGACIGWIDATLAFFLAAFVGLYFVIVRVIWVGAAGRAMPYGPYLAAATLLVFVGKPWVEQGLEMLFRQRINLP